ncbi:MAG TPA: hypothetical protein VEC12_06110 [Bacteroidia bacterium]|nr:hypothetical protein [Bacteroidia bacterium]
MNHSAEFTRLSRIKGLINLYYDNPFNFTDVHRLLIGEREIYPDHTTYYGNDLRLTSKMADGLANQIKSGGNISESEYNDFLSHFMKDIEDELTRLNPSAV